MEQIWADVDHATVAATLKDTKGLIYLSAQKLGCTAAVLQGMVDADPELTAIIAQQRGEIADAAELVIYSAIVAREPWAVKYYLETKARDRGYFVDRFEAKRLPEDGRPAQNQM